MRWIVLWLVLTVGFGAFMAGTGEMTTAELGVGNAGGVAMVAGVATFLISQGVKKKA